MEPRGFDRAGIKQLHQSEEICYTIIKGSCKVFSIWSEDTVESLQWNIKTCLLFGHVQEELFKGNKQIS